MKARPILFSAPMVRALLAGTKTQTRRVLRDQNPIDLGASRHGAHLSRQPVFDRVANAAVGHRHAPVICPYGQPSDRLWVRETHAINPHPSELGLTRDSIPGTWDSAVAAASRVIYAADPGAHLEADGRQWRPSIHMPRWASRIMLEITGVRVERLQDISEADAIAEGIAPAYDGWRDYRTSQAVNYPCADSAIHSYQTLWEQISGSGSWEANPWVWAVEFKRVEGSAT